MFSSAQARCSTVQPLADKRLSGSARLDIEWLLAKSNRLEMDVVDGETREQILHSLMYRMRQRSSLRRVSIKKGVNAPAGQWSQAERL